MALVAYENSDSSDYEDDIDGSTKTAAALVSDIQVNKIVDKATASSEESINDRQTLFNLLPRPSAVKTVIEEDDEFLHKKVTIKTEQKPKSKITVPSLNDFKDVDSVPSLKPKNVGEKKSGLLSILPQPKNGVKSTTKSLVPNVLQHKPQKNTYKKPSTEKTEKTGTKTSSLLNDYSDESDTDDIQNDFFSIHKPVELPAEEELPLDIEQKAKKVIKIIPRSIESYFKKEDPSDIPEDLNMETYNETTIISEPVTDIPESSSNEIISDSNEAVLDEEAIMKLCGTRAKRRREEIQIVDVNQQEVLNDAKQWLLKGLIEDTSKRQSASKKRGNEPTSQQRRKHQITYLAHQAKAKEAELENQWANSRMNKRKTQSKYGF